MNIPSQFGQGPSTCTDYQSLYGARPAGTSTFAQTIAQTQSSCLSLTTTEGDLVTFSDLGMSYQQTQGVGWFTPSSSGMNVSSSSMTAEAMGLSVQGDLNEQELADITRLVGELTSIASSFFSGDYDGALAGAMDFGALGLGTVSSLAASFSRQTVTHTRITSNATLPAMADLKGLNLKDLFPKPGATGTEAMDYAKLLEARWQQVLKALETIQEETLNSMLARPVEQPQPAPVNEPAAETAAAPQPPANDPPPAIPEAEAVDQASLPAEERAARQMLARMEPLFADHPKVTPFAKALASLAMEKAAVRADHARPDTARALGRLHNSFLNQLHQWFSPPEQPGAGRPETAA